MYSCGMSAGGALHFTWLNNESPHHLIMKRWPPDATSSGYFGPYPVNEINRARSKLIQCLVPPHSPGLAKVLPKIGVESCFGPGIVLPPPHCLPNGLVTPHTSREMPEKTVAMSPLSVTKSTPLSLAKSASFGSSSAITVSDWQPMHSVSRSVSVHDTRQNNVHQTDHTQQGGIRNSHAQSISTAKRRYSEFSSTDAGAVKRMRDNGASVVNKDRGQSDASLTQETALKLGSEPLSSSCSSAQLPPSHVYKCDYCRVTAASDAEITNHLSRSRHASASEYSIVTSGDVGKNGPELQAVERMLAISNPHRGNCAALVIACPECRSIFDDIFTCATHNKYEHGASDGCYAVCPVIHSEKVDVSDKSCAVCQQQFNDYEDLVQHWLALPDHCHMPQSADTRVFLVQTCPTCKRTFSDDFLDCVLHMAEVHGTTMSVEVRHVMLPQRRERLPPFSSNRHSTGGLHDEATVLSRLQNCFEQNAINARLEQIQKILGVA